MMINIVIMVVILVVIVVRAQSKYRFKRDYVFSWNLDEIYSNRMILDRDIKEIHLGFSKVAELVKSHNHSKSEYKAVHEYTEYIESLIIKVRCYFTLIENSKKDENRFEISLSEVELIEHYANKLMLLKNHIRISRANSEKSSIHETKDVETSYENNNQFGDIGWSDLDEQQSQCFNWAQSKLEDYEMLSKTREQEEVFNKLVDKYKRDIIEANNLKKMNPIDMFLERDGFLSHDYFQMISHIESEIVSKCQLRRRDFCHIHSLKSKHSGYQKKTTVFTYDNLSVLEAINIIKGALSILGISVTEKLEKSIQNKWINTICRSERVVVAKCFRFEKMKPYIVLNYNGTLEDVLTLAHELGHAIVHDLVNSHQIDVNSILGCWDECIPILFEVMTLDYLEKNTYDVHDLYQLRNKYLKKLYGVTLKQIIITQFSTFVYDCIINQINFNYDSLNEKWNELNHRYSKLVNIHGGIFKHWTKIPHMFWDFSSYRYIVGCCKAIEMLKKIQHEPECCFTGVIEELAANHKNFKKLSCNSYLDLYIGLNNLVLDEGSI